MTHSLMMSIAKMVAYVTVASKEHPDAPAGLRRPAINKDANAVNAWLNSIETE